MSTSGPHQAIAWQEVKAGKHAPSGRGGASVCEVCAVVGSLLHYQLPSMHLYALG